MKIVNLGKTNPEINQDQTYIFNLKQAIIKADLEMAEKEKELKKYAGLEKELKEIEIKISDCKKELNNLEDKNKNYEKQIIDKKERADYLDKVLEELTEVKTELEIENEQNKEINKAFEEKIKNISILLVEKEEELKDTIKENGEIKEIIEEQKARKEKTNLEILAGLKDLEEKEKQTKEEASKILAEAEEKALSRLKEIDLQEEAFENRKAGLEKDRELFYIELDKFKEESSKEKKALEILKAELEGKQKRLEDRERIVENNKREVVIEMMRIAERKKIQIEKEAIDKFLKQ